LAADHKAIWSLTDIQDMLRSTLPPEQRIFFIPRANAIAAIGEGNNQILLRRFNVMEALEKAGIDYLFVTSTSPPNGARGMVYQYTMQAASKRGSVKYSLASGPDGLNVSADGKVEWSVPASFAGDQASVIVSVKDASGQEVFHAFKITIAKPVKASPTPKAPRGG